MILFIEFPVPLKRLKGGDQLVQQQQQCNSAVETKPSEQPPITVTRRYLSKLTICSAQIQKKTEKDKSSRLKLSDISGDLEQSDRLLPRDPRFVAANIVT